jgi:hypothetical protein
VSENKLGETFRNGSDLRGRESQLLTTIESSLDFHPVELLGRSTWWGSEAIGAFMYAGTYHDQEAVLKVQGMKPDVSEITMLQGFAENQSALVRPPSLLASQSWSDKERYEALVIERLVGPKLISRPTNAGEVHEFFGMYDNYRRNCRNRPWVPKTEQALSDIVAQNFSDWQHASRELYPDHPYRQTDDDKIVEKGVGLLQKGYHNITPEFQHKHISTDDVFKVDSEYILTSNFMWGWGAPFGDAVFAYHWYPYIIGNHVDGLTSNDIEQQKGLWLNEIWQIPQNDQEKTMITLALLERQLAGLVIDSLTLPLEKPLAQFLVESTRLEVTKDSFRQRQRCSNT